MVPKIIKKDQQFPITKLDANKIKTRKCIETEGVPKPKLCSCIYRFSSCRILLTAALAGSPRDHHCGLHRICLLGRRLSQQTTATPVMDKGETSCNWNSANGKSRAKPAAEWEVEMNF